MNEKKLNILLSCAMLLLLLSAVLPLVLLFSGPTVAAAPAPYRVGKRKRRAARRIPFVPVVRLHDLHVEGGAECVGKPLRELFEQPRAERHVAADKERHVRRCCPDGGEIRRGVAGGCQHGRAVPRRGKGKQTAERRRG